MFFFPRGDGLPVFNYRESGYLWRLINDFRTMKESFIYYIEKSTRDNGESAELAGFKGVNCSCKDAGTGRKTLLAGVR